MSNRSAFRSAGWLLCACVLWTAASVPVLAEQSPEELATANAQLARALAEVDEAHSVQVEILRQAAAQAIAEVQTSGTPQDRQALALLERGNIDAGLSAFETRATRRDSEVREIVAVPEAARTAVQVEALAGRAEDWNRIGALAILDNPQRAVTAYENALRFNPNDTDALNRLAALYELLGREAERAHVVDRLVGSDDPRAQVYGLLNRAEMDMVQRMSCNRARSMIEQATDLARARRLLREEIQANTLLATCELARNRYRQAEAILRGSLARSDENDFREEGNYALFSLGAMFKRRGEEVLLGGGRTYFEQADEAFSLLEQRLSRQNDIITMTFARIEHGSVAARLGRLRQSEQMLREAVSTLNRFGISLRASYAQQQLATTLSLEGNYEEAVELFRQSIDTARAQHSALYEGMAFSAWSEAESRQAFMGYRQVNGDVAGHQMLACQLAQQSHGAFQRVGTMVGGVLAMSARMDVELRCNP